MKRKLFSTFGIIICLLAIPITVWADTKTYTPPAQKGTVWVIIRHKKMYPPMDTKISIIWGRWSKEKSINAGCFRYSCEGVVIKLNHKKDDSVPITVSTDGKIVDVYQGNEPSQWTNKNWKQESW